MPAAAVAPRGPRATRHAKEADRDRLRRSEMENMHERAIKAAARYVDIKGYERLSPSSPSAADP